MDVFFTSRRGPDIQMNVLEDCIKFLVKGAWVLFDFYLKQKQSYSVWSLTENINFIPFHGRILSRYSQINKFKTGKDLIFK